MNLRTLHREQQYKDFTLPLWNGSNDLSYMPLVVTESAGSESKSVTLGHRAKDLSLGPTSPKGWDWSPKLSIVMKRKKGNFSDFTKCWIFATPPPPRSWGRARHLHWKSLPFSSREEAGTMPSTLLPTLPKPASGFQTQGQWNDLGVFPTGVPPLGMGAVSTLWSVTVTTAPAYSCSDPCGGGKVCYSFFDNGSSRV